MFVLSNIHYTVDKGIIKQEDLQVICFDCISLYIV